MGILLGGATISVTTGLAVVSFYGVSYATMRKVMRRGRKVKPGRRPRTD